MDVDKAVAQLAKSGKRNGKVIDVSATLAGSGDDAADGGGRREIEIVIGEERLKVLGKGEGTFDDAVFCRILLNPGLGASTQKKTESTEKNGLTGAGLARDDIEVRSEGHIETVDKRIVLNGKRPQHRSSVLMRTTACAATPCWRPTKPRPSVVVALRETWPGSIFRAEERAERI